MNAAEKLVEMKEKHRLQMQTSFSCIEMFLNNRKQCGVERDDKFIEWLTSKIAEDKRKAEVLFKEYEKMFPDD